MATEEGKKDGNMEQQQQQPQQRTKRKRWGEKVTDATTTTTATGGGGISSSIQQQQPVTAVPSSTMHSAAAAVTNGTQQQVVDPKEKILAMQESIRARLAAAKAAMHQPSIAAAAAAATTITTTSIPSGLLKRPLEQSTGTTAASAVTAIGNIQQQPVTKKARVYELDLSVTAPTFHDDDNTTNNGDDDGKKSVRINDTKAGTVKAPTTLLSVGQKKDSTIVQPPLKSMNPYLAHLSTAAASMNEDGEIDTIDTGIDPRLEHATNKVRKRHKEFHFIEPGTYQEIAKMKREKEMKAIASGYISGRKTGHTIIAPSLLGSIGSNVDPAVLSISSAAVDYDIDTEVLLPRPEYDTQQSSTMPIAMEWWDIELLPSKLKKEVAAVESQLLIDQTTKKTKIKRSDAETNQHNDRGTHDVENETNGDDDIIGNLRQRCFDEASFNYSKTSKLVQHIVPVQPTNVVKAESNQKPMVLHLTKKELKRQRKLRRREQQQEQQDLQAAGLLPAPEPRLTLRNFIQVLGDQAYIDPSQIEQKVQEQMLARQRTHYERNEAAKLTKEQRAAKMARKLQEDTTLSVTTALFFVKDMSHPYHRTKVDLNAQQWNLSGCVVECTQEPLPFACIIVEGGPKAIKRYSRLMLVRMKWTGPDDNIEDDDNDVDMPDNMDETNDRVEAHKFNPNNTCQLIWQGLSVKRLFNGFTFQLCTTHEQGRKLFKIKGAVQYWEQILQHALSSSSSVNPNNPSSSILKLKLYSPEDTNNSIDDDDDNDDVVVA